MKEVSEKDVMQRFRAALDAAGSMRVLATRVGVSSGYVGDVAVGRRRVAGRLARYLGVELLEVYREVANDGQ